MRYFELRDDVKIPGRWHLGEVTFADGSEPRLSAGIRLEREGGLRAPISHPGRVLDFCLTSFAVPVASSGLAGAVKAVAGRDVQCVPVDVPGQAGMMVLNSVRVIRCLDEGRSEFLKWTQDDHRADLAGQYRQVTRLTVDSGAIPPDAHFFRIEGWLIALIVSDAVKAAMERTGCVGARFIDVTPTER